MRQNLDAIRLAFGLDREGRPATESERTILSAYSGFGGLKFILNPCDMESDKGRWSQGDLPYFEMAQELYRLLLSNSVTEDEYKAYVSSVKNSILSSFYTPRPVVEAIVKSFKDSGIEIRRYLDPSAGSGVFLDAFQKAYPQMKATAYEKDLLTGKILQALHSDVQVHVDGFETAAKTDEGKYDFVCSNIPFGNIKVFDPDFFHSGDAVKKFSTHAIHNYFFMKAMDQVREGGFVAFITSRGFMDSPSNDSIRERLIKNARLVGAYRLPDGMFSDESGTEVGSDLIVLQKHLGYDASLDPESQAFCEAKKGFSSMGGDDYSDITMNEYFWQGLLVDGGERYFISTDIQKGTDPYGKPALVFTHSGNVEGIAKDLSSSMRKDFLYSPEYKRYYDEHVSLQPISSVMENRQEQESTSSVLRHPSPRSSRERRKTADAAMQLSLFDLWDVPVAEPQESKPDLSPRPYQGLYRRHYRHGVWLEDGGQLGILDMNEHLFIPKELKAYQEQMMLQYIKVRDAYEELYRKEAEERLAADDLREELNVHYDHFFLKFGHMNESKNAKVIMLDALGRDSLSLERGEDGSFVKADIFERPVSFHVDEVEISDAQEALSASLNRFGRVNLDWMRQAADYENNERLLEELKGKIYYNPEQDNYEVAEKFLSGNVIEKQDLLKSFQELHPEDLRVTESLEAIQKVVPTPVPFEDLDFNFGERWISPRIYEEYVSQLFGADINGKEVIETNWHEGIEWSSIQETYEKWVQTDEKTVNREAMRLYSVQNNGQELFTEEEKSGLDETKLASLAKARVEVGIFHDDERDDFKAQCRFLALHEVLSKEVGHAIRWSHYQKALERAAHSYEGESFYVVRTALRKSIMEDDAESKEILRVRHGIDWETGDRFPKELNKDNLFNSEISVRAMRVVEEPRSGVQAMQEVRDVLIDRMRQSGIQVITDVNVGQRVLEDETRPRIKFDSSPTFRVPTAREIEEVNQRFNEELQKQIDGKLEVGHIYKLGLPGEILQSAGFPDNNIELSSTHLLGKTRQDNHPYNLEDVKGLVKALNDPLAVFVYGKVNKAQNVIVELDRDGKKFLVGVHFNQERNGIVVSDIRGIFNKENANWLNWISQGKLLYVNKEKTQALIAEQRTNLAEVSYLDLDFVTKIIENFENPKFYDEKIKEHRAFLSETEEKVHEFAFKHGLSVLNVINVGNYAKAMREHNLLEAQQAYYAIRRDLKESQHSTTLSEFTTLFVPLKEDLYSTFGSVDELREEWIREAEEQRGVMEAAKAEIEQKAQAERERLQPLRDMSDDEIDADYAVALSNQDEGRMRDIIDVMAERRGYGTASDYQGVGGWSAPGNPGYTTNIDRWAAMDNDESPDVNIYDIALGHSPQPDDYFLNPRGYMYDNPQGLESRQAIYAAMSAVRSQYPDSVMVKVYRAVPNDIQEGTFRNGDWVTPSLTYAKHHGDARFGIGEYHIMEQEVSATQLWWDGNDINEWGFDDGNGYRYKNTPNNRKSDDLITYDDQGNVIPPSKRFDDRTSDIRYQFVPAHPVFISNARLAVERIKQEKATSTQWLAMITKNGGMKAGEDKWTGLSAWLREKADIKLTKQQVLDYISENEIDVQEVHYSEFSLDNHIKWASYQEEFDVIVDRLQSEGVENVGDSALEEMAGKYGDDFRLAFEWQVGNDGTLPSLAVQEDIYEDYTEAARYFLDIDKKINSTRNEYTTDSVENKHEIALVVPTIESWSAGDDIHFGDAGDGRAVAWVRFGDTTVRREKVMVIDEIQSKRHQDGREFGYSTIFNAAKALELRETLTDAQRDLDRVYTNFRRHATDPHYDALSLAEEEILVRDAEQKVTDLRKQLDAFEKLVPDAPFEKNWHEVAMKRILRYAADNGYDRVAWTTGEQQAERYDLGSVVDAIDVNPYEAQSPTEVDGFDVTIITSSRNNIELFVNNEGVVSSSEYPEYHDKQLSEIVGKPMATKILASKDGGFFQGDDLRIGIDGMKGFYDEMLPRFMNKYGKQWNAKVEDVELPQIGNGGLTMHSVIVNDAMKESVRQGQPLFFRTGNGQIYGFVKNDAIYIDPRIATAETPIHEYTHLWAEVMRQRNPAEWKNIVGLMKDVPEIWNQVKTDYPDLQTDDDIAEEVLAHYSGKRGYQRLQEEVAKLGNPDKQTLFDCLVEALTRFWEGVADFLHLHYTTKEQVADQILSDLLNGVNPLEYGNVRIEDQTKTATFKEWFGDWELANKEVNIVSTDIKHGFNNFGEARNWAKENIARIYSDVETGGKGEIRISNTAIDKYLSNDAVSNSFSRDVHLSVLRILPEVLRKGVDAEQHPDYKKIGDKRNPVNGFSPNVQIHCVFGAVNIGEDLYRVKITLKAFLNLEEKTKAYSYEATKIELLEGSLGVENQLPRTSNNSISIAKLLQNVEKSYEKGKKLLDSSKIVDKDGKPLVVEHATNADFTEFDISHLGENSKDDGLFGAGFYFGTHAPGWMSDAKNVMKVYLNIKHPFEVEDTLHLDIYGEMKQKMDSPSMRGLTLTGFNGNQLTVGEYIDHIKAVDALIAEGGHIALMAQDEELEFVHPRERERVWREHEIASRTGLGSLGMSWQVVISEHIGSLQFTDAAMKDGYDGVIVDRGEGYKEYVAFEPNQIKSATDNIGTFRSTSNDIRFHFIGERGATSMDVATDGIAMSLLEHAKEQEGLGLNPLFIKRCTGWERGVDDKWRYEIYGKVQIKDMITVGNGQVGYKTEPRVPSDMLWNSGTLEECIDAPELFAAYPQLKGIRIETDTLVGENVSHGDYHHDKRLITIHATEIGYMNDVLSHEIQHAIQHIEGFALGGNVATAAEMRRDAAQQTIDKYQPVYDRQQYLESGIYHEDSHVALQYLDELDRFNAEHREELQAYHSALDSLEVAELDIIESRHSEKSFEEYKRLAGEAEARNVVRRSKMSRDVRENSLAAETEDVPREQQIVNLGGAKHAALLSADELSLEFPIKQSETIKKEQSMIYEEDLTQEQNDFIDALEEGLGLNGNTQPVQSDQESEVKKLLIHHIDDSLLLEEGDVLYGYIETLVNRSQILTWEDVEKVAIDVTDKVYHQLSRDELKEMGFDVNDVLLDLKSSAKDDGRAIASNVKMHYTEPQYQTLLHQGNSINLKTNSTMDDKEKELRQQQEQKQQSATAQVNDSEGKTKKEGRFAKMDYSKYSLPEGAVLVSASVEEDDTVKSGFRLDAVVDISGEQHSLSAGLYANNVEDLEVGKVDYMGLAPVLLRKQVAEIMGVELPKPERKVKDAKASEVKAAPFSDQQEQKVQKKNPLENIDYSKYSLPEGMTVAKVNIHKEEKGANAGKQVLSAVVNGKWKTAVLYPNDIRAFFSKRANLMQLAAKYWGEGAKRSSDQKEKAEKESSAKKEQEVQGAQEKTRREKAQKDPKEEKISTGVVEAMLVGGALAAAAESGGVFLNKEAKAFPSFLKSSSVPTGFNALMMALHSDEKGYKSNVYAAYQTIVGQGGFVKKGEKSMVYHFQNFSNYEHQYTHQVIDKAAYDALDSKEKEVYKVVPVREDRKIFNLDQTTLPSKKYIALPENEDISPEVRIERALSELSEGHPDTVLLLKEGEDYKVFGQQVPVVAAALGVSPTMDISTDSMYVNILAEEVESSIKALHASGLTIGKVELLDSQLPSSLPEASVIYDAADKLVNAVRESGGKVSEVSPESGASLYDSLQDVLQVKTREEVLLGGEKNQALSAVNDVYRAVVAYVGGPERLNRSYANQDPETAARYERLVQELSAGVLMSKQGLPARISKENLALVPYWTRELKENPKLIARLERDVDNAIGVIHRIERGEQLSAIIKRSEPVRPAKPVSYSIQRYLDRLPDSESKKMVIIRDVQARSAAVIMPAGASLEVNNELPGMSKNRISLALKKEGMETVTFHNAGGELGLNKPNDYYSGKTVEVTRLKGYDLERGVALDVSKEIDKVYTIKEFNRGITPKGEIAYYIKPVNEKGVVVLADSAGEAQYWKAVKSGDKVQIDLMRKDLGNRFYLTGQEHPELQRSFIPEISKDFDMSRVKNVFFEKQGEEHVLSAVVDGEKMTVPVSEKDWHDQLMTEDSAAYRAALAVKALGLDGQAQFREEGQEVVSGAEVDTPDVVETVQEQETQQPEEQTRRSPGRGR